MGETPATMVDRPSGSTQSGLIVYRITIHTGICFATDLCLCSGTYRSLSISDSRIPLNNQAGSRGVQETAWQSMLGSISYRHLLAALATGILGSGMFYLVYQWALAAGSEVAANLFTYLQPVATILMAVVLLGESVGWSFVIGGVLAVIGAHVARK